MMNWFVPRRPPLGAGGGRNAKRKVCVSMGKSSKRIIQVDERVPVSQLIPLSIQHVFADLKEIAETGKTGETYRYLDVRE